MKVNFSQEVLNDKSTWRKLDRIVYFFEDKTHIIDIDVWNELIDSQWIKSNKEIIEKSYVESEWQSKKRHSLMITITKTTYSDKKLSPDDAYKCLSKPVYVVVENATSDGFFLDAMITAFKRSDLEKDKDKLWQYYQMGGKGEVEKCVEMIRKRTTGLMRVIIITDSDCKYPGEISETIKKVKDYCDKVKDIPYKILLKREVENYLPIESIGKEQFEVEHKKTFDAFISLTHEQKDFFDMKEGFKKKKKNNKAILGVQSELYKDVHEDTLKNLCGGFGNNIAKMFNTHIDKITEDSIRQICSSDSKDSNNGYYPDPDEIPEILDMIEGLI